MKTLVTLLAAGLISTTAMASGFGGPIDTYGTVLNDLGRGAAKRAVADGAGGPAVLETYGSVLSDLDRAGRPCLIAATQARAPIDTYGSVMFDLQDGPREIASITRDDCKTM